MKKNSSIPSASPDDDLSAPLGKIWVCGLLFLLLICILPFANGDLLFDEASTLDLYVLPQENPLGIFRDYSMANNHILSNVVYWLWLALIGNNIIFFGVLLRLPSILFSVGTVLLAFHGWNRFLGQRKAFLAALLMAISPAFSNYSWQVRGYSLIIFLATILVTASLERIRNRTNANGIVVFLVSMLLPLTMPSAIMLPVAIGLALFATHLFVQRDFTAGLRSMAPAFFGTCLGGGYYLTLGSQFWHAAQAAGGWTAFWPTIGNIALAIILHCSIFSWFLVGLGGAVGRHVVQFFRTKSKSPKEEVISAYPAFLSASSLLVILGLLLCRNPIYKYPFPRVFILMLVPFTYVAVSSIHPIISVSVFRKLIFCTLAIGFLCHLGCHLYVARARNDFSLQCDNLLVQGDRGTDCPSSLAQIVVSERKETGESVTFVNGNYVPATGLYCKLYGYYGLSNGFLSIMDARWFTQDILRRAIQHQVKLKILTRNEEEAVAIQQQFPQDFPSCLIPRKQYGEYRYYEITFSATTAPDKTP